MQPQPAAAPDDDVSDLHPLAADGPANPGYLLLQLLSLHGWQITIRTTLASGGVLLTAHHPELDLVVFQQGNTVAEILCEVVKEATHREHEARRRPFPMRDAA